MTNQKAQVRTMVTHAAKDGSDFRQGLRAHFAYRDTGIANITGGALTAHVIKAIPGEETVPEWHCHETEFQMFYVLKGWIEFEYEDIGHARMEAGATVFQPNGIRHRELAHSDDLEMLEIVSPASFTTTSLPAQGQLD